MSWKIFIQLIKRDMLVFKKVYLGKLLDVSLTFVFWVLVFGYFVPKMGAETNYGLFIMVGAIASFGIFDLIGQSGTMINDIQGNRTISYLLMLPISSRLVFCYAAISWSIQSFLLALPLYFVGKALFWSQFSLRNITWYQLGIVFITVNIFFGFFALWIVSVLHKVTDLSRIYFRFLNPLFIFGCYFYTWRVAYDLSPWIGYVSLIDPFCYIMEISRVALIGQSGYLPFWASFCALWAFIIIFGLHATKRLKRILDCL
ncbi:MAG: hypothetical protein S4CHLAM6_16050 [Chlamydiae bacterium]|nr:hypothetical protein [Chlamydiota bacterium]